MPGGVTTWRSLGALPCVNAVICLLRINLSLVSLYGDAKCSNWYSTYQFNQIVNNAFSITCFKLCVGGSLLRLVNIWVTQFGWWSRHLHQGVGGKIARRPLNSVPKAWITRKNGICVIGYNIIKYRLYIWSKCLSCQQYVVGTSNFNPSLWPPTSATCVRTHHTSGVHVNSERIITLHTYKSAIYEYLAAKQLFITLWV